MSLKSILTGSMMVAAASMSASVPSTFMVQASTGSASTDLEAKVTIHRGSPAGAVVYAETHSVTTDAVGVLTLNVGTGTATEGSFDAIDWADGEYWLETGTDTGAGYVSCGASKLASVPYALAAAQAQSLIMSSPSGKRFVVSVDDEGKLVSSPVE